MIILYFSVAGLCGVVQVPTANDNRLDCVCGLFVLGFNGNAHDVSHLTAVVVVVLK